jgi:hypothetical protein
MSATPSKKLSWQGTHGRSAEVRISVFLVENQCKQNIYMLFKAILTGVMMPADTIAQPRKLR